jgi:site-specific recombinase XerD
VLGPVGTQDLIDRLAAAVSGRQYSPRTRKAYVGWVRRFLAFHQWRDPAKMAEPEVRRFLTYLAVSRTVAASTQNQAFSALLFLYRVVLRRDLVGLGDTPRAKLPVRLPVVLSPAEVDAVLMRLEKSVWLVCSLIYGSGLRLDEALRMRVKDVDFGRSVIVVRDGKGRKDRETIMPRKLVESLRRHLQRVCWLATVASCCLTRWSASTRRLLGRRAAVGFPCHEDVRQPRERALPAVPLGRDGRSEGVQRRHQGGRDREACDDPHVAALVRDASP